MTKLYIVKDGKAVLSNPYCPRCCVGFLMTDKGEWWSCGDRYHKKAARELCASTILG